MKITIQPLTAEAFAPFGDVLEVGGEYRVINDGQCNRYHDRAILDFGPEVEGGRAGISVFNANPRALPYQFDLIERHPEGSQAFVPLNDQPFLVIVAHGPDSTPLAFKTNGRQGINFHRGTWHGVLTPLAGSTCATAGLFAVVDRIGPTANIEEHRFATPFTVVA